MTAFAVDTGKVRLTKFYFCLGLLIIALLAGAVRAQTIDAGADKRPDSTHYALALQQIGNLDDDLALRGVDDRQGLPFGIRSDQRVKRLQLDLAYRRSPALIEQLSHLNILLNGEVVSTISLSEPRHDEDGWNSVKADLPTQLLQPYNQLAIQLIAHYTLRCEDPVHPDLWADIGKQSRLIFDVEPLVLPDELGLLPSPFFDPRDVRRLNLPIVISGVTDARLEAAGVLASWFGAMAGYRGAHFPVSTDTLPEHGNAVFIGRAADGVAGMNLPEPVGPTVTIRPNPNDPTGKMLIVTGRNDEEIMSAAKALALGAQTLSGATAQLNKLQVEPRQPYDAPNWLPTNRPVTLGELLPVDDLTRRGRAAPPISINLNLPPDLSNWRIKTVPIKLRYQQSTTSDDDEGALNVSVNHTHIARFPLADRMKTGQQWMSGDLSAIQRTVHVPLDKLGSLASMQFQFGYRVPPQEECRNSLLDSRRSAIDPESTIDLSGIPHHIAMPDLAAFSTSGFPFTRMADLSETIAIVPAQSGPSEYGALLTLLGRAGRVTGYPATGIKVKHGAEAADLVGKDILLIESGKPSPLLTQWADRLPQAERSDNQAAAVSGWKPGDIITRLSNLLGTRTHPSPTAVSARSSPAYFAGFESPVSSSRSVIVARGKDGQQLLSAVELLIDNEAQAQRVQGGLSIVYDNRVESVSKGRTYYVGNLGFYQTTLWFFGRYPLALIAVYLLGALLAGAVFYSILHARARQRLRIQDSDE